VAAAITMGGALTLPAVMLVGGPGLGKTWYTSRLAAALGLPVRTLAMNALSLGDSLTGAFPVWRNAREGLVARTLLSEATMNPVFLVDEIDKPAAYNNEDPYRPFYTVLEPENARSLVDDYLGFPMDASLASWVLAGNTLQNLPAPILDRLVVFTIPDMDDAQRRIVADSVHAEVNATKGGFFDPHLPDEVADRLASLTARGMRRALGDAMVRAAAAGRRSLLPDDVVTDPVPGQGRIGFGPWS
jgi:ATP-dependent Lon protease